MKKILTLMLSLALLCVMAVPAMAADTIDRKGGSTSADVKGTYVPGSGTATVYSVDIAWGSLEFTYTDADGNFTGFDTELATAVCEKLGRYTELFR